MLTSTLSNPYLCSNTAQVQRPGYNQVRVKELCKNSVTDWLTENGHPDLAYRIEACGSTFVHLKDANGHEKYARMYCKNDFCPTCGVNMSSSHKRRVVRALDRLIWAKILGYMVFTLPKEVSASRPDRETLYYLSKKAWQVVKDNFQAPGGLVRTHLMGEEPESLHIHINVLFPVLSADGLGRVPQDTLDNIRNVWTGIVNNFFELTCDNTNVFYKFATDKGHKIHKVKYVLRPIVTPERFLTLSEQDRRYVISLMGWHNSRWYGKLANSQYKNYLQSQGVNLVAYEDKDIGISSKCPICGQAYRFVGVVHRDDLPGNQVGRYDKDTLVDLETYYYLLAET